MRSLSIRKMNRSASSSGGPSRCLSLGGNKQAGDLFLEPYTNWLYLPKFGR